MDRAESDDIAGFSENHQDSPDPAGPRLWHMVCGLGGGFEGLRTDGSGWVGCTWGTCIFEDIMPTHDEIFQKVQTTLVDALGVDADDVTPDATLRGDLGAESIDLLDIVFRLERNFGIKIPRGELFPENISDPELTHDGKLTDKGLAELKQRMPYADLSEFAKNPEVERILDLYTVEMLVQYVSGKLTA
jgi:acyl carrier protein